MRSRPKGSPSTTTKGFWRPRPYTALENLTPVTSSKGEVFGFLGPNGAGKTTTLKLLMQLIYPTSGRAEILGRPVGDVSVRRRIGYLPENPYFYDNLTAEELLVYFARCSATRREEGRARASRLLDEVGIGAERRFQLRKFSKGHGPARRASPRPSSTTPRSCSSTSRCQVSIRSAAARCAS